MAFIITNPHVRSIEPHKANLLPTISLLFCFLLNLVPLSATESSTIMPSCTNPNQTYDQQYQRCCMRCPRGSGVALPCGDKNDTICDPCPTGTYSGEDSHTAHCLQCSTCPINGYQVHACNETHNTKCRCNKGYFGTLIGNNIYACRRCTVCQPGEHIKDHQCSHLRDARCEKCPTGYFTTRKNMRNCSPCTVCSSGETVVTKCLPYQDTVCSDSSLAKNKSGGNSFLSDGSNLIPVYCALFGALFVGLVIYVILKRWNLCPRKPLVKTSGTCAQLLPTTHSQPQNLNVLIAAQNNRWSPKKTMPTAESQQKLLPMPVMGCKLSSNCLQNLESRIGSERMPDGQEEFWVSLAIRLGYGNQVTTMRQEAQMLSISPVRVLLERWNNDGTKSDVFSLVKALQQLGRQDLTDILCQHGQGIITI